MVDRTAVTAAVRRALDAVAGTGRERPRDVTVVVPDAAVRVLSAGLRSAAGEGGGGAAGGAVPAEEAAAVRCGRCDGELPGDVESRRTRCRLLAVAMPKAVLEEYEAVVLAAGYLPGAVLPSTLAALAGLDERDGSGAGGECGGGSGDDGDCAGWDAAAASVGSDMSGARWIGGARPVMTARFAAGGSGEHG